MYGTAAACNIPLIFHGSIVLLVSQIAGYAFLFAINTSPKPPQQESPKVGMWRMSHSACSVGAVFLIALGPVVPHLDLTPPAAAFLVGALIVSTYALCVGTVVAGISGHRGTRLRLPWSNLITTVLYLIGALGSTISGIVLMYGVTRAYLAAP
jgi:hypothetical protein